MSHVTDYAASLPLHPRTPTAEPPANDKTPHQREEDAVESRADAIEVLLGVRGMVLDGQSALAIVERLDEVINALPSREIWTSPTTPWDGQPEQRNAHDVLVSLAQLAEEQLAVSRHILAALGTTSEDRTSVKIETGAKREFKAVVHCYDGDTDTAANTWLVQETIRLHQLAQAYCEEAGAKT